MLVIDTKGTPAERGIQQGRDCSSLFLPWAKHVLQQIAERTEAPSPEDAARRLKTRIDGHRQRVAAVYPEVLEECAGVDTDPLDAAAREIVETDHGGNFMMSPATLELLRGSEEYYEPRTFNRAGAAAPPVLCRAHDEVERIVAEWKSPVPEDTRADIERMLHV